MKPQRWVLHKLYSRLDWEFCTDITIVWGFAAWPSRLVATAWLVTELGPCPAQDSVKSHRLLISSSFCPLRLSERPQLCWWSLLLEEAQDTKKETIPSDLWEDPWRRCYCMLLILRCTFFSHLFILLKSDAAKRYCGHHWLYMQKCGPRFSAATSCEWCAMSIPQDLRFIVVKISSKWCHCAMNWSEKLLYMQEGAETEPCNMW